MKMLRAFRGVALMSNTRICLGNRKQPYVWTFITITRYNDTGSIGKRHDVEKALLNRQKVSICLLNSWDE